jgi:hypothetical protein
VPGQACNATDLTLCGSLVYGFIILLPKVLWESVLLPWFDVVLAQNALAFKYMWFYSRNDMKMIYHPLEDFQTGCYNNFTFWQRPSC